MSEGWVGIGGRLFQIEQHIKDTNGKEHVALSRSKTNSSWWEYKWSETGRRGR